MIAMNVCERVTMAYNEYQILLASLKEMSKEERFRKYEFYSKLLFPKKKGTPVNLEDQLSPRKDYKKKFKECFGVVGSYMLSTAHMGECCFQLFRDMMINKTVCDRYIQKVILSLGMLGYLTEIKESYSNSGENSHGYKYKVDICKFSKFDMDMTNWYIDGDVDWSDCSEWYGDTQYKTITSMSVVPNLLEEAKTYNAEYNKFFQHYELKDGERKSMNIVSITQPLFSIDNGDTYRLMRHKIDDYGGRFYTIMTNMSGEARRNCLTIGGEHLSEVDVSSAQPTFLGLKLKEQNPNIESEWLHHCLDGTFYEWLNQVTKIFPKFGSKERVIIKEWTMQFLYSTNKITDKPKAWKSPYKHFEYQLYHYLFNNERELFSILNHHKTHLSMVKRKTPTKSGRTTKKRNDLSRELTKIEVNYIKACLEAISNEITYFYTIHDCIGCLERDAERVKQIMEDVSVKMFGEHIRLKIERGNDNFHIPIFDASKAVVRKKTGTDPDESMPETL